MPVLDFSDYIREKLQLKALTFFNNIFFFNSIPEYATKAANTNIIHEKSHADAALNPSELGEFEVRLFIRLISTRNRVTNNVILPGTTSGSITKLTYTNLRKYLLSTISTLI